MMRFGPAGLGSAKEAVSNLEKYAKLGLKACEIAFTYGIYIKDETSAREIGKKARELDIKLSIHAPYWLNFNSAEKRKIEESKRRVLDCCKIGELLGAKIVVFHAGFYGKTKKSSERTSGRSEMRKSMSISDIEREISYLNIKKAVSDMLGEIRKNKWKIKIAPETMGKINVFGSSDEILKLVKETGCSFCLDFAHLWAREQGKISYTEVYEKFRHFPEIHAHFSGIEFGSKGERNHKETPKDKIKKLLKALPKNKEITIINESPNPVNDAVKMIEIWKES